MPGSPDQTVDRCAQVQVNSKAQQEGAVMVAGSNRGSASVAPVLYEGSQKSRQGHTSRILHHQSPLPAAAFSLQLMRPPAAPVGL